MSKATLAHLFSTTAALLAVATFSISVTAQEANSDAPPAPTEEVPPGAPTPDATPTPAPTPTPGATEGGDPLFEGDISYFTSSLPASVTIKVRRERMVVGEDGKETRRTFYEQQTIDPRTSALKPEQRLGLFIAVTEKQIEQNVKALEEITDAESRQRTIETLKDQYKARFEYDTAYQDFRAREVEDYGKMLRNEVDARKQAADSWVQAMVTLVETRLSGIETMDALVPSSPTVRISQAPQQ